jgi:hypothetical protein
MRAITLESLRHGNPCIRDALRSTWLVQSKTMNKQKEPEILSTLSTDSELSYFKTHTHSLSLPIFFLGKTENSPLPAMPWWYLWITGII